MIPGNSCNGTFLKETKFAILFKYSVVREEEFRGKFSRGPKSYSLWWTCSTKALLDIRSTMRSYYGSNLEAAKVFAHYSKVANELVQNDYQLVSIFRLGVAKKHNLILWCPISNSGYFDEELSQILPAKITLFLGFFWKLAKFPRK